MKRIIVLLLMLNIGMATLLAQQLPQTCHTVSSGAPVPANLIQSIDTTFDRCAAIRVEVDYPTYVNWGNNMAEVQAKTDSTLATVARIYDSSAMEHYNVHLDLEFDIHYWTSPTVYAGPSSQQFLFSFAQNHLPHNSMTAILLGAGSSGGVAYVDVACHPAGYNVAFANTIDIHASGLDYSWNVMVIAHELGHNFGSEHTQACVWNGNNTAIDGCVQPVGCPDPGAPAGGGTIMSYCHLTQAGINFRKGFEKQPMAVIINGIDNANCSTCVNEPPPPPPPPACEGTEIYINITPDVHTEDITWSIINEAGNEVASGGPYNRDEAFSEQRDTLCLEDDCYYFEILDVDGLAGAACGDGSYEVITPDQTFFGSAFSGSAGHTFCLGDVGTECDLPGFVDLQSYANQDVDGLATVEDGELHLRRNTWKSMYYVKEITPNTVIELDHRLIKEGEIHGLAIVQSNSGLQPNRTFRLSGTQNWWGIDLLDDDEPIFDVWRHYSIPVGQVFEQEGLLGEHLYLVFVNDHDLGTRDAESYFRNVEVCELSGPENAYRQPLRYNIGRGDEPGIAEAPWLGYQWSEIELPEWKEPLRPNPCSDILYLNSNGDREQYRLIDATGSLLSKGYADRLVVSWLPAGVYTVIRTDRQDRFVKQ